MMSALVGTGLIVSMVVLLDVWSPWVGFIQVSTSTFDKVREDIATVLLLSVDADDDVVPALDVGIDHNAVLEVCTPSPVALCHKSNLVQCLHARTLHRRPSPSTACAALLFAESTKGPGPAQEFGVCGDTRRYE